MISERIFDILSFISANFAFCAWADLGISDIKRRINIWILCGWLKIGLLCF